MDRLEQIKDKYISKSDDMKWLISEVERLRIAHMDAENTHSRAIRKLEDKLCHFMPEV